MTFNKKGYLSLLNLYEHIQNAKYKQYMHR